MGLDVRPNLIIAGAQKAGTTTLATRLAAHPQIFMPPEKELNFFTKTKWYLDIESYLRRYAGGGEMAYRLDATPGYLWTDRTDRRFCMPTSNPKPPIPESIRSFLGADTKILMILRHPSMRAISGFFHQFRMGRIGTADRIRNLPRQFGLVDIGFYSDHIKNYRKVFSEENIRVFFLEKYGANKPLYDRIIFDWLSLNPDEVSDLGKPKVKEDSNANFRITFDGRVLAFKDGIDQVNSLRQRDPRYKKMLEVDPPVVEPEDIEFLNRIYASELAEMRRLYPETGEIWREDITLADY